MPYSTPQNVTDIVNIPFSVSSNPTVSQVTDYIVKIDAWINDFCRHNWTQNTVTDQYYDAEGGLRAGMILLKAPGPVLSIDKVEYYDGDTWKQAQEGFPKEHPTDQTYLTTLPLGAIYFNGLVLIGRKLIRVSYKYGYTEVPASVNELSASLAAVKVFLYLSGPQYASASVDGLTISNPPEGPYSFQIAQLQKRITELKWQISTRRPLAGVG